MWSSNVKKKELKMQSSIFKLTRQVVFENKLREFFSKNPNKNSVIVKFDSSVGPTYWNVGRTEGGYDVKEACISKSRFFND